MPRSFRTSATGCVSEQSARIWLTRGGSRAVLDAGKGSAPGAKTGAKYPAAAPASSPVRRPTTKAATAAARCNGMALYVCPSSGYVNSLDPRPAQRLLRQRPARGGSHWADKYCVNREWNHPTTDVHCTAHPACGLEVGVADQHVCAGLPAGMRSGGIHPRCGLSIALGARNSSAEGLQVEASFVAAGFRALQ